MKLICFSFTGHGMLSLGTICFEQLKTLLLIVLSVNIRCIRIGVLKITTIERLNILLFQLNHNMSRQTYRTSAPDNKASPVMSTYRTRWTETPNSYLTNIPGMRKFCQNLIFCSSCSFTTKHQIPTKMDTRNDRDVLYFVEDLKHQYQILQ